MFGESEQRVRGKRSHVQIYGMRRQLSWRAKGEHWDRWKISRAYIKDGKIIRGKKGHVGWVGAVSWGRRARGEGKQQFAGRSLP